MSAEVVLVGLEAPEGPVLLAPGDVVFVEQVRGQVSRVNDQGVSVVVRRSGALNAVTLGSDGCLYAAQNGGVVNDWRSAVPAVPSIERIRLDGTTDVVAGEAGGLPLLAPNDLAFGPDGRLYVTDPSEPYDPEHRRATARICAFGPDGGQTVASVGASYANGLAFLTGDRLCWVESYTRRVRVLGDEGEPRTVATLPEGHIPDGIAVAEDGRIFIASVTSGGVTVIGPAGEYLGLITLDDRANPTNLCFDGGVLWVTDFGADFRPGDGDGRLWRVDTDARGHPLYAGSL